MKSFHPWQSPARGWTSVIQTIYDIVKANGGGPVPMAIGIKVESDEEGATFIIRIPTL